MYPIFTMYFLPYFIYEGQCWELLCTVKSIKFDGVISVLNYALRGKPTLELVFLAKDVLNIQKFS